MLLFGLNASILLLQGALAILRRGVLAILRLYAVGHLRRDALADRSLHVLDPQIRYALGLLLHSELADLRRNGIARLSLCESGCPLRSESGRLLIGGAGRRYRNAPVRLFQRDIGRLRRDVLAALEGSGAGFLFQGGVAIQFQCELVHRLRGESNYLHRCALGILRRR